WLSELGTPWLTFLEPTAVGDRMERRALFEPDLDVDFSIFPAEEAAQLPHNPDAAAVLRRGFRVLLDRDGTGEVLASLPPQPPPPAMELFHWLGEETAARLGFAYPIAEHERAAAVVEALTLPSSGCLTPDGEARSAPRR